MLLKVHGQDHFDYFYENEDEFIFPMTIHPDVSGRPHVLLMHQRYIFRKTNKSHQCLTNYAGSLITLINMKE
jgi:hypothetical protein